MNRKFSKFYAIICTLLLATGFLLAFYFAWKKDIDAIIECLIGLVIGFVFSPILHELGHIVTFEMMRGGANGKRLQELYGITDERMDSWRRNEQGYEVPTSEEDPDTLSYGVYLMWGTFFLSHADGKNL